MFYNFIKAWNGVLVQIARCSEVTASFQYREVQRMLCKSCKVILNAQFIIRFVKIISLSPLLVIFIYINKIQKEPNVMDVNPEGSMHPITLVVNKEDKNNPELNLNDLVNSYFDEILPPRVSLCKNCGPNSIFEETVM
jgi:hypothetical protein